MTILHITNGDSAANMLKAGPLEGDVLPWRDPMHHGPFPEGDLDAVGEIRARYLAGPDPAEGLLDFRLRDEHLRVAGRYDEVVLWFEHDLLDQLQILQILDWFADTDLTPSLICIDAFEGIVPFRGLGQLDAEQMASLIDTRRTVTKVQLVLAQRSWRAFRQPDPRALETFLTEDLTPLPFLRTALRRHLEEYPWVSDGLTRTERQIVSLVAQGVTAPGQVFLQNMESETALFIGDWPTFSTIAFLCDAGLLACTPSPFQYPPGLSIDRDTFRAQCLTVTETGTSVLAGERATLPRDLWLGGVHLLSGKPMWRWDAEAERLTRA